MIPAILALAIDEYLGKLDSLILEKENSELWLCVASSSCGGVVLYIY